MVTEWITYPILAVSLVTLRVDSALIVPGAGAYHHRCLPDSIFKSSVETF